MKVAELICENAEGYTELRLPVGRYETGHTEISLIAKQLDTILVTNRHSENEECHKNYTLYDTVEGPRIYKEEWLVLGSIERQAGQAPAELSEVQSWLYSIDEARAVDSPVMREVLKRFSEYL
jgi:hypothetical protein